MNIKPPYPEYNSRRQFLKNSSIVSLGFLFLSKCSTTALGAPPPSNQRNFISTDPLGYLDLPEGFRYRIIAKIGKPMDDGFLVPGRADGMGAFPGPDGKVILVINHENSPTPLYNSPFGKNNKLLKKLDLAKVYDAGMEKRPGLGGTTTLIYDEATQKVEKHFLSLAGTYRNCAGGVTPWNSWLSCEEDVTPMAGMTEKDHGFVFEVPATDQIGLADPHPIKAMGRFNHEAVCVDPRTGIVYQTEDRPDGLLYRYIPKVPGQLAKGGRLQALAVKTQPSLDTSNWKAQNLNLRQPLEVYWIDLEDVLSPEDNLRYQGFENGAAQFARGEGIWFGDGELFFACTIGGANGTGQVFKYTPSPNEGKEREPQKPGLLELFAESEEKTILHCCDNLTIAPWGDVILCEDNGEVNHIRGINKFGQIYTFGINRSSTSEFAGLTFSPSGETLFVNIQDHGETLAITGPWDRLT